MTIIVDDIREQVFFIGFTGEQLAHLAAIVRLARKSSDTEVRNTASRVHLFVPTVTQERAYGPLVPMLQFTWEELLDLSATVLWLLNLTAPRYSLLLDVDTVKALDAAVGGILASMNRTRRIG